MNKSYLTKTVMTCALALLGLTPFNRANADELIDPGIPDTVRVVSVQVNAGDHFPLVIYLWNDEILGAATLGFGWGTSDLFLDSISYVGTRTASTDFPSVKINNNAHLGLTGFATFFGDPLPAGEGEFAILWFTADANAADQEIKIDSSFVPPAGPFILVNQSDVSQIKPQFVMGTVTIGNPNSNTPPTITGIADQFVAEGDSLSVAISASDAETIPSLSVTGLAPFMSFDGQGAASGTFRATPGFSDAGNYPITVIASDGELADTVNFIVEVTETNQAPVWTQVADQEMDEAEGLFVLMIADDPDGDSLNITVLSSPVGFQLVGFDGFPYEGGDTAVIFFGPDFTDAGVYEILVEASDGQLGDTLSFQLTVNNVNRPPAFVPLFSRTIDVGDTLLVTVSALDQDGDSLTLELTNPPDSNVTFTDRGDGTGIFIFAPSVSQGDSTYLFIFRASDQDTSVTEDYEVIVNPAVVLNDSAFISPDTLLLTIPVGDPNDRTVCVFLTSTNAPASFIIVSDTDCVFNTSPMVLEGITDDTVCLSVNAGDLPPGEYSCRYLYIVEGVVNNPVELIISLTIEAAPQTPDSAFVSPDTLFFSAPEGADVILGDCAWLSSTNAPADYSVFLNGQQGPFFTSLVDSSGVTNDSVCVTVNPSGLSAGTYYNSVVYTVDSVSNNPIELVLCLNVRAPLSTTVQLDIKPGSCPNPLNTKGRNAQHKAVLPVAIVGTINFDVRDIDVSSLTLEGVSPVRWSYEDVSEPIDRFSECDCRETKPDSIEDLTLKFYRSELIDALGGLVGIDEISLTITGKLNDGSEFSASDCIETRPKDKDGNGATSIPIGADGPPQVFTLVGNYPNPFNPSTKITFGIPESEHVTISVYNVQGQKVATLVDGVLEAGYHDVEWDASNLASGMYFYRLQATSFSQTRKMILLK
ncbi:MAG: T9SS type A sorting domain-containing protein [candidate division Zixibacteria bacterium]|nr:T9SS type A sorting domain-containing protein [candidate division Zixibacteria bacterium]